MKDQDQNPSAPLSEDEGAIVPGDRGEFLLYQTSDGRTRVECRFQDETIWLSQAMMAELYQKDVRTINDHLRNIYGEGELEPETTIRKYRIVRREGSREVARRIEAAQHDRHTRICVEEMDMVPQTSESSAAVSMVRRAEAKQSNMAFSVLHVMRQVETHDDEQGIQACLRCRDSAIPHNNLCHLWRGGGHDTRSRAPPEVSSRSPDLPTW